MNFCISFIVVIASLVSVCITQQFDALDTCPYCVGNSCPTFDFCPLCTGWKKECCNSIKGELRCNFLGCFCKIDSSNVPPGKDCGLACTACGEVNGKRGCYRCVLEKECPSSLVNSDWYCNDEKAIECIGPSQPIKPPYKSPVEPPYGYPEEPPFEEPYEQPSYDSYHDNGYEPPVSKGIVLSGWSLTTAFCYFILVLI